MTAVDVLVVGGGPSGLSAATAAAEAGASVTLMDEWPTLGGRLRYRRADVVLGERSIRPGELVASLVEQAREAGVDLRPGTVAWSAFAGSRGLEVGIRNESRGAEVATPSRLILATGTTDRAPIVPGATLPGVMTARALQILLRVHRVRPGQRFAVLGDERADELMADIEAAGGQVVRQVPASELGATMIDGEDGVRGITVAGVPTEADIVVTALGTMPDTQIAGMLGCAARADGAWPPAPRRADDGSLRVPGVFACGSSAGAGSIEASILDGARVGRGQADEAADAAFAARLIGGGAIR